MAIRDAKWWWSISTNPSSFISRITSIKKEPLASSTHYRVTMKCSWWKKQYKYIISPNLRLVKTVTKMGFSFPLQLLTLLTPTVTPLGDTFDKLVIVDSYVGVWYGNMVFRSPPIHFAIDMEPAITSQSPCSFWWTSIWVSGLLIVDGHCFQASSNGTNP